MALLEQIFVNQDAIPPTAIAGHYVVQLVVASYAIAAFGSFVALRLADNLSNDIPLFYRRLFHVGGALVLGCAIWSMHFVGMMAYDMDMPVNYGKPLTFASMVIAVITAYGVLQITAEQELRWHRILVSACLLGFAICGMHYVGMSAMQMDGVFKYIPSLAFLSVCIAIFASAAALYMVFSLARSKSRYRTLLQITASLVMGIAVCGMHYTGIAASVFIPFIECRTIATKDHAFLLLAITGINAVVLGIGYGVSLYNARSARNGVTAFPVGMMALKNIFSAFALAASAYFSYQVNQKLALYLRTDDHNSFLKLEHDAGLFFYFSFFALVFVIIAWGVFVLSLRGWKSALEHATEKANELEKQEKNQRKFLDTLLDNMPISIFVKSATDDYRYVMTNKAAEISFGKTQEQMVGRTDFELFPKEEAEFFRFNDIAVMAGRKRLEFEAEPVTTPHGNILARVHKVPIFDENGKPSLMLGMLEDVTARIQEREELRIAKIGAEQANQAKSEFLANMSHELRTPMNSILGMMQLVLDDERLSQSHRELLQVSYKSGTNLVEIVNSILDLSKIEAQEFKLENIAFKPASIIADVVKTMLPVASKRGLLIVNESAISDKTAVMGDPLRFGRILTNLLGNAVKYTEHGHISIAANEAIRANGDVILSIKIKDTGIGIPPDKLDTIFDKFTQADASTTRKYGGTGLGLAITKHLVEMMGGKIYVTSALNEGSEFEVVITFTAAQELLSPDQTKASSTPNILPMTTDRTPIERARILVAEDHVLNQLFIQKLLEQIGARNIDIVEDGEQALNALRNNHYHLALLDGHMPIMSGYDVTVEHRRYEAQTHGHVPLVALTANAMSGDREKCMNCGMDDYLSKPVFRDELMAVLRRWLILTDETKDKIA